MKKLTLALALLFATTLAAEAPRARNRTIIVRDGKVINDTDAVHVRRELLGRRAHLGVNLIDLTAELRDHYGASKDAGVLVGAVEDGSPADKAGLRVGDIVLSIDGKDVASAVDLRLAMLEKKEGDTVRLEVLRGRSRQTVVATVAERERVRLVTGNELRDLPIVLDSPEWRARLEALGPNCNDLQTRIKELEGRLKDLEKKLQK
ncbi:MAG TPA: PDZ domain-containing protein [Thermoanaerobaculia bacterium]